MEALDPKKPFWTSIPVIIGALTALIGAVATLLSLFHDGKANNGPETTYLDSPTVYTDTVIDITQSSAIVKGRVVSDGGADVNERGVCYSNSINPTINGDKTIEGSGTGPFFSLLNGLIPGTVYFTRAYAINNIGVSYGKPLSFITLENISPVTPPNPSDKELTTPTVETLTVNEITQKTATTGGKVLSDGGAKVSERGVCWSISSNPNVLGRKTDDGSGTGVFYSYLTDLAPNTLYYIRAYATNAEGTAYGQTVSFSTTAPASNLPTLTTTAPYNITQNSATTGGNVTSDGGAEVTERGVCWGTSAYPAVSGNKTHDGLGQGVYSSYLTSLMSNTLYYVRAYATNKTGTTYGDQLSFQTIAQTPPQPAKITVNFTIPSWAPNPIPGAKGYIRYYKNQVRQYTAEVDLRGLTPNTKYIFTINGRDGASSPTNSLLYKSFGTNAREEKYGNIYADFAQVITNNVGNANTYVTIALYPGVYIVNFFVKESISYDVVLAGEKLNIIIE